MSLIPNYAEKYSSTLATRSANTGVVGWLGQSATTVEDATGKVTNWIDGVSGSISGGLSRIAGGIRDITESTKVKTEVSVDGGVKTIAYVVIGIVVLKLLKVF